MQSKTSMIVFIAIALLLLLAWNAERTLYADPLKTHDSGHGQSTEQMLMANLNPNLTQRTHFKSQMSSTTAGSNGTQVQFGGYIKLDAIISTYSDGSHTTAPIGEDFLVPSTIPIGGDSSGNRIHLHAKESRFFMKSKTVLGSGSITTHFEVDGMGSAQGDERISNSYSIRLRHAYVDWDDGDGFSLLAGQSWSTFFNVGALPELCDFVGPVGTIFERQAQIRFTNQLNKGSVQIALENPSSTLYGGNSNPYDDNALPDVVIRYNGHTEQINYSIAAMLRELAYEEPAVDDTTNGYAVSLSGLMKLGKNNVKAMANYGNALGRYLGLNSYRAGAIDSNGAIKLIDQWGGVIAYQHNWSDKWRSNFVISASHADNPDFIDDGTASDYQSFHFNLMHSPVAKLSLGGEYVMASKSVENSNNTLSDEKGELNRLQFSVKYVL